MTDELFFANEKKQEKGLTKENTKKLFKWEGWKKEVAWILLFIFLGLIIWAYLTETKQCREMTNSEEFREFLFNKAIEKIREENPTASFSNCDYKTNSCQVSGISEDVLKQWGIYGRS